MRAENYRLGFLVSTMDSEVGTTLTTSINRFYDTRYDADLLMFYQELTYVDKVPMFACFNSTESYDFSGDIMATDLVGAANLLRCPGPRKRYFYVGDAEWSCHRTSMTYLDFVSVYRNPLLQILTPTVEMAGLVQTTWNRGVHAVVDLSDMEGVLKTLRW